MSSQRRDQYSNERPIFGVCPAPPASRRSPGSSGAPDPGRRSSPPGRRSHKEPGREGMRFLAAQSPCSPGSSSLPRPGPPSCLLIISFYSFLKRSPVFYPTFHFSTIRGCSPPSDPGSAAPFSRRQADSPPPPLRCSPRSPLLSPTAFNFTRAQL